MVGEGRGQPAAFLKHCLTARIDLEYRFLEL
jgi:hypothetical protein